MRQIFPRGQQLSSLWRSVSLRWRVASCVAGIVVLLASSLVVALNVHNASAATKPAWPKIDPNSLPHHGAQQHTQGTGASLLDARAQLAKLPAASHPPAVNRGRGPHASPGNPSGAWHNVNAGPISYYGFTNVSGPVSAIAVDPTTSGASTVIYIGTFGGGVWKSVNNGQSWFPLTDSQISLEITSLALDPTNHNTIYAGTEYPFNGYSTGLSTGVLKSTDGGTSWSFNGAATLSANFAINQIAVDPNNNQHVFVAGDGGFFLSTDGSVTFSLVTGLPVNSADAVAINSSVNPSAVYVGIEHNGIYESTTGGGASSFVPLTTGLPAPANIRYIGLAIAPSSPGVLYTVIADPSTNTVFTAGVYNGGYYTTDGGAHWFQMNSLNQNFAFFPILTVDPHNDQTLYGFDGQDLFVSTAARAGGGNWQNITNTNGFDNSAITPFVNAVGFPACAAPCPIYVGTEGGVYYTGAPTAGSFSVSYANLNTTGLAIENMFGGAVGPNYVNGHLALAGTPFGEILYNGTPGWPRVRQYTLGSPVIDQGFAANMYGISCYPQRSLDGGLDWSYAGGVSPNQLTSCVSGNIAMDPSVDSHLAVGTSRFSAGFFHGQVWETGNGGWTWYPSSQLFPTASANPTVVTIAPANSAVIYVGLTNGEVWSTTTAYSNTQQTYVQQASLPGRASAIMVDPTDTTGQIVYATTRYPNSGPDTANIFKSVNGGASWTNITGSLPTYPVNGALTYHSGSPLALVIAADYGVAYTTDDGAHWTTLNNGLPNVSVGQISMDAQRTTLMAFTNGRGAWSTDIPETSGGTGDTPGVVLPGGNTFYLRNSLSGGAADETVTLGSSSMTAIAGDWNGDGVSTPGVYDSSSGVFYLQDANTTGAPLTHVFAFGPGGNLCKPVVGDWTGKGSDSVGIYCSGTFYLRNSLSGGPADYTMTFGPSSGTPVSGDWAGLGRHSVGVYYPTNGVFYLTNAICTCNPSPNYTVAFGPTNSTPVTGDWTHAGQTGIGIVSGGVFYLRNNATTTGSPDFVFAYGASFEQVVAGHWI